ncbi:MAG TPA: hypothetical protein VMT15_02790 [Bryobacteraceae bacterium]|nr:hypothetical protein [Bryobacteraceae bacterium]
MKHLYSIALCVTLTAATAAAGVSPALLNLVMPDATVLSGVNVDQSIGSPFGQYILSQMQFNDTEFQQLLALTGFDPRKDLHEILAATPSTSTSTTHTGLILGRGIFNPAMVLSTATNQGAILSVYKGFTLIGPPPSSSPNQPPVALALTFLDGSTAAMGDAVSVKGVIDRKLAGAAFTGPLAASALQVSANNSAWFATTTPLSDFMSARPSTNLGPVAQSGLMQSIIAASGGVLFGTTALTLTADCVTANPQNAQALVDVLKFFVSMIAGNTNAPSGVVSIASSAQFAVNGSTAHISLLLPEAQVEQLLMPKANGARKRSAAVR